MLLSIAVVQMTSCADVNSNLKTVDEQLAKLNTDKVKLVILPENFAFMGLHEKSKLDIAESYQEGPIQVAISQMAKKYDLWIVAGTIPIKSKDPSRCYASSLVFNANGECVARYDKIHLFDVTVSDSESHKESNSTLAGSAIKVVNTPIGKIGLSVCYDLRFPELYRALKEADADIFIVPAAFTFDTGKYHWQTLLKARAIENLSYVAAPNQAGTHQNGRKTFGHSMIISPWGKVEAECDGSETSTITAEIDSDSMNRMRQKFPCLNHRKM